MFEFALFAERSISDWKGKFKPPSKIINETVISFAMLEAFSLGWFFLGFAVGIFLDIVWRRTGVSKHERRVEMFEHYHWGLILLILARIAKILSVTFAGMGLYLVFAELTQRHPFAIRSSHEFPSTIIGVMLAVPLILAYITL